MASIFTDLSCIPGLALDPRFAGLVRLCGLGFPGKWIETRLFSTTYRGPVVIYATTGQSTRNDIALAEAFDEARSRLVPHIVPSDVFERETTTTSRVVALATISDCRPLLPSDAAAAFFSSQPTDKRPRQAWILRNVWPLIPFEATPAPGFFRVPVDRVQASVDIWLTRTGCPEAFFAVRYP